MIPSRFRIVGALAVAAIVVGACSSAAATTAPAAGPTTNVVATVPADQLIKAGTLTVCSDTSYPPQESLDSSNNAVGSDIDLAKEIAKRLGLTLSVQSTTFDTIIPALVGGSCDIIISAQTITADRQAAVDMIPYFAAGQSFVVLAGNPSNINTIDDLCGKAVAAEKGTIEADHIAGTGSGYDNTNSLDANCAAKGKSTINLQVFDADTDALLALQAGTVVAHFTDEPVAGYEVEQSGGKFQMIPSMTLERGAEGISVTKNHTALEAAVKTALLSMISDGTYTQILTKWGGQSGAITATDVNATPLPAAPSAS
ncbi:MAG: ABC transporter substrate-binding protein [Verrucomicrobiota bacterium]